MGELLAFINVEEFAQERSILIAELEANGIYGIDQDPHLNRLYYRMRSKAKRDRLVFPAVLPEVSVVHDFSLDEATDGFTLNEKCIAHYIANGESITSAIRLAGSTYTVSHLKLILKSKMVLNGTVARVHLNGSSPVPSSLLEPS